MTQEQQELRGLQRIFAELPEEMREQTKKVVTVFRALLDATGQPGLIAFALLGAEIAALGDDEEST